jgi:radical SAM protein with 4Fe4S-binding SPASM domain
MKKICLKPWENILVEINGDCYFCCFSIRPGGKIGNLNRNTLKEVWNSKKATKIREKIMKGKIPYSCQICPYFGEFKHEKSYVYKVYFYAHKIYDLLFDLRKGDFTRYRLSLKVKNILP